MAALWINEAQTRSHLNATFLTVRHHDCTFWHIRLCVNNNIRTYSQGILFPISNLEAYWWTGLFVRMIIKLPSSHTWYTIFHPQMRQVFDFAHDECEEIYKYAHHHEWIVVRILKTHKNRWGPVNGVEMMRFGIWYAKRPTRFCVRSFFLHLFLRSLILSGARKTKTTIRCLHKFTFIRLYVGAHTFHKVFMISGRLVVGGCEKIAKVIVVHRKQRTYSDLRRLRSAKRANIIPSGTNRWQTPYNKLLDQWIINIACGSFSRNDLNRFARSGRWENAHTEGMTLDVQVGTWCSRESCCLRRKTNGKHNGSVLFVCVCVCLWRLVQCVISTIFGGRHLFEVDVLVYFSRYFPILHCCAFVCIVCRIELNSILVEQNFSYARSTNKLSCVRYLLLRTSKLHNVGKIKHQRQRSHDMNTYM